jgi:AcrR family transcriptional regulator
VSKARRREELLEAARKVFAERGYHEAKVGEIAAAANVAKGTVYLYFPDKRSIFVELIDDLFGRLSAAILRVDPAADVTDQIKHNIRAILSVLVDDPDTMKMLFAHASAVDPAFSAKIESFYEGLKQLLTESLEDGQQLGIVAEGDAPLYATFTLGALKEILWETTLRAEARRTREEIVDALYELLERGYLRVAEDAQPAGD